MDEQVFGFEIPEFFQNKKIIKFELKFIKFYCSTCRWCFWNAGIRTSEWLARHRNFKMNGKISIWEGKFQKKKKKKKILGQTMHEGIPISQRSSSRWRALLRRRILISSTGICHLGKTRPWTPAIKNGPKKITLFFFTMKGWSMFESKVFSFITWSTCFNLMISAFFKIFKATHLLVILFLANFTLPKDPMKIANIIIKFEGFLEPVPKVWWIS